MYNFILSATITCVLFVSLASPLSAANQQQIGSLKIESPAFTNNQAIPIKYTCEGENINPPLNFSGVPKEAQSLVLIVEDPDAPNGGMIHWMTWNIPPDITSFAEGMKVIADRTNDVGKQIYQGPCPPQGSEHHYHFNLYALDELLVIPNQSNKAQLEASMKGHIIDQAKLIGTYKSENKKS